MVLFSRVRTADPGLPSKTRGTRLTLVYATPYNAPYTSLRHAIQRALHSSSLRHAIQPGGPRGPRGAQGAPGGPRGSLGPGPFWAFFGPGLFPGPRGPAPGPGPFPGSLARVPGLFPGSRAFSRGPGPQCAYLLGPWAPMCVPLGPWGPNVRTSWGPGAPWGPLGPYGALGPMGPWALEAAIAADLVPLQWFHVACRDHGRKASKCYPML